MKRVIKAWFTDKNGDPEIQYVWVSLGLLVFLGLSVASWHKFDPQAWGIGFGAMAAGCGTLMALRGRYTQTTQ